MTSSGKYILIPDSEGGKQCINVCSVIYIYILYKKCVYFNIGYIIFRVTKNHIELVKCIRTYLYVNRRLPSYQSTGFRIRDLGYNGRYWFTRNVYTDSNSTPLIEPKRSTRVRLTWSGIFTF